MKLKTFALRAITVVALVGVAMPLKAVEHDAKVQSNRGVSADARQEAQASKETESEKSKGMQKRSTGGKRLKKFVLGAIKTAVVVKTVKAVMPRKAVERGLAPDQDSLQHASECKKEQESMGDGDAVELAEGWGAIPMHHISTFVFVLIAFLFWRKYRQGRKQEANADDLDETGHDMAGRKP